MRDKMNRDRKIQRKAEHKLSKQKTAIKENKRTNYLLLKKQKRKGELYDRQGIGSQLTDNDQKDEWVHR